MLLRLDKLHAGYGAMDVLHGVSLEVEAGEALAIIGPNGAGKSVLLKALAGLLAARAGGIAFNGEDITRLPAAARARRGLALMPQAGMVFAGMTVEENLLMGVYAERDRLERSALLARSYERYPLVAENRRRIAGALSGGQQKLVGLARAMISEPRLLLLDEPSIGLDPKSLALFGAELAILNAAGVTLILVEQNIRFAVAMARRVCFLELGLIRRDEPAANFAADSNLLALYFGVTPTQSNMEPKGVEHGHNSI